MGSAWGMHEAHSARACSGVSLHPQQVVRVFQLLLLHHMQTHAIAEA